MIDVTHFNNNPPYEFLSNFWPSPVIGPGDLTYPTVEHAYQAAKSTNPTFWKEILKCGSPGTAKKLGQKVRLRSDWEQIKIVVMAALLVQKFSIGSDLADQLQTIDGQIEEGNWWGDKFWGVDLKTKEGSNHLGKLLMKLRDKLNAKKEKEKT